MGWESLGTDRPDFLTPRRTLFFSESCGLLLDTCFDGLLIAEDRAQKSGEVASVYLRGLIPLCLPESGFCAHLSG